MSGIPSSRDSANLRLNRRRAVVLRWWLIGSVAVAVVVAPAGLGVALPRSAMLAVLVLLAAFNAYVLWRTRGDAAASEGELFSELCVDIAAMGVLLYLSGGAANPLISLLLVPVAVAALALRGLLAALAATLAVGIYSLLTVAFLPLAVAEPERATRLHLAGMWLTFVLSVAMITWFVARMTASIRERDRRLAAAREQALRDERVVALGALAAGAAHELGTPLATMAVIVGELEADASLDAQTREDMALVRQQIGLCKEIISDMAARAGAHRADGGDLRNAVEWLQAVRSRWQAMRPRATSRIVFDFAAEAPAIAVDGTLEQAVTNLLNNAADASADETEIDVSWNGASLTICIADRGPGFPADTLARAGREPMPARPGHGGIGLLLAFAAIERRGGRLRLENPPGGGAQARIELPLGPTHIEPEGRTGASA